MILHTPSFKLTFYDHPKKSKFKLRQAKTKQQLDTEGVNVPVSPLAVEAQTGDQAACIAASESMRCRYAWAVRFMGTGLSGKLRAPPALACMQDRR